MVKATNLPEVKMPRTFEEAVSMAGYGKYNLYLLLVTGGCLMCVIIETMCAMFIIPAAQCDLNLSLSEKGILYSISFFGVVSGSHFWGFLADTRGRKNILLFSLISSAISSFICSIVSIPWLFIALRFINGIFIGGSSAIIYAYAGEFHDNTYRPKVVSWIATFVAFGNIYLPGLAWVVLSQSWSVEITALDILFRPWRLLIIIYALPSLIFAVPIYFLPESPKYLLTVGKHDEVLAILKRIFCVNTGKSEEEYMVSNITFNENLATGIELDKHDNLLKSMWKQTIPLFKRMYLLKTLMVCFLHFGIFLTTSAIIMWYPQILNSMTDYGKNVSPGEVTMCKSILYDADNLEEVPFSKSRSSTKCNDNVNTEVFLVSLAVGSAYVVCYTFIGTVINVVGKKNLLIGFVTVTTVAGLCAQLLSGYSYIQIAITVFLMAAAGVGIINAVVVDLYPTQIRGMALSVSLMVGRFGAMSGSNIAGPLMFTLCDYMFYIFAAIHILIIIVIVLLPSDVPPELKQSSEAK